MPISIEPAKALPTVAITSTLRLSAPYAPIFVEQLRRQISLRHRLVSVTVIHDDHASNAAEALIDMAGGDGLFHFVKETAADNEIRTRSEKAQQWARIGNQALEHALESGADYILVLEADLCIPCDLIDQLIRRRKDILAPVVFLGVNFYDSWGFRTVEGARVRTLDDLPKGDPTGLTELGSVGSCVLVRREVLDAGVRYRGEYDDGLLVGLCRDARALGFSVWADRMMCIVHPTSLWREQVWKLRELRVIGLDGTVTARLEALDALIPSAFPEAVSDFVATNPRSREHVQGRSFAVRVDRNDGDRSLSADIILRP
jgi:hypothetical protein